MPAIIIHNENNDTAAFVASVEHLTGIRYTVLEDDGTSAFMRDRDDLRKQIRDVIDEVMGLLGFKISRGQPEPQPAEPFKGENETTG